MSPKNHPLTAGLTALGLFGIVGLSAAVPEEPPAPTAPSPAAAIATAPAPVATPTVLLLSNGLVIQGSISREGADYVIRQRAGTIRFPQTQVEKTCGSIIEVYEYKRTLVPPDDPDEHLKLARWCLSQNLHTEAKAELQAVVAIAPRSGAAKAMLGMIEAREARAAQPRVDSGLVQARAENDGSMPAGRVQRPEELGTAPLPRASRRQGLSGPPVIFELPPTVAMQRAEQFARTVHPVLQAACAKCHNEQYDGAFQLIEVKSRKGLTADVHRANLDATLRFIDPEDPSKSQLLSIVLLPHGGAASKRPIFRGSNDRLFHDISVWVNSLRPLRSKDALTQARFGGTGREPSGGFASDRSPTPLPFTPTPPTPPINSADPNEARQGEAGNRGVNFGPLNVVPSSRYVNGKGMVVEKTPASSDEFPAPYLAGGPKPKLNNAPPAVPPRFVPGSDISAGVPYTPGMLPGGPVASEPPPTSAPVVPAGKPKTSVKIDPGLLEKALMNRNTPR